MLHTYVDRLLLSFRHKRISSSGPTSPPSSNIAGWWEASVGVDQSTNYGQVSSWAGTNGQSLAFSTNKPRVHTGLRPAVYNWLPESNAKLVNTTLSINKRDASFFALVELDNYVIGHGGNISLPLMYIPTNVGDLYVYSAMTGTQGYLAWKDGTGSYVSTLPVCSSLMLVGVTLSASGVTIYCQDQSQAIAAALTAGTATGFELFQGSIPASAFNGSIHSMVWYSADMSASIASIRSWATDRGVVLDASSTKQFFVTGASRGVGYHAEGNLGHGKQYAQSGTGIYYANFGTGGIGTSTQSVYALQHLGAALSYVPGTANNDPTKAQAVLMEIATGDITNATTAATIIATLTNLRESIRGNGYDLIVNGMPPSSDWDAGQLQKALDVNTGMAALDSRRYGTFLPVPSELTTGGVGANPTYFYDAIHYKKAGFDVLYNNFKSYFDAWLADPVTTLKGKWDFNGNYQDTSRYKRDCEAFGSPTFTSGLNGKQALVCTTGNNAARGVTVGRFYDRLPLSYMFWFKVNTPATYVTLIVKSASAGGSKIWGAGVLSNGKLIASMSDTTAPGYCQSSSTTWADGGWKCMAVTITEASGVTMYGASDGNAANLALLATNAWVGAPSVPSTGTGNGAIRFGNDNNTTSYPVTIQGARLWFADKTLSEFQAETP